MQYVWNLEFMEEIDGDIASQECHQEILLHYRIW